MTYIEAVHEAMKLIAAGGIVVSWFSVNWRIPV
jgi:hypothetical protein